MIPRTTQLRALSLAAFVSLWWAAALIARNSALLPGPPAVLAFAWHATISGDMPRNIAITTLRVAAAFAISMLAGSAIGYLAGRSPRADTLIDPWLVILLNLPVLVVVVLCYIWIGLNDIAAVLAVALVKVPTVMVTVREGARALDPGFDELASVYRLSWQQRARRIVAPQLAPYLAAAGRSGLSITWKIVLIVELLGRPNGVGFALDELFQTFDVAGILAYGFAFAILMLLVEGFLLRPWEGHANAWRR
ncbi:MAG TPA: ABC transporter permease subunit [Acetobacteraceae bacterium]|nr:ABC transporter permease subunit [Acetobacteraceae bacterium]